MGVSAGLLKAAVEYAISRGADIIEGYPVETEKEKVPDSELFPGLSSVFLQTGFKEVLRRLDKRPIMRFMV